MRTNSSPIQKGAFCILIILKATYVDKISIVRYTVVNITMAELDLSLQNLIDKHFQFENK